MQELVKFRQGTSAAYQAATKSDDTLYFLSDTRQIMKGSEDYTSSVFVVDNLPDNPIKGKLYIVGRKGYVFKEFEGAYQWFAVWDIEEIEDSIQSLSDRLDSAESDIEILKQDTNKLKDYTDHLVFNSVVEAEEYLNSDEAKEIYFGRRLSIITEGVYLSYIVQPGSNGKEYSVVPIDTDTQMVWSDIDEDVVYTEIESPEDIASALNVESGPVNLEIKNDLTVSADTLFTVKSGVDAIVKIDEGKTIETSARLFDVEDGATLTLSGTGTIKTSMVKTNGIISAAGANSKIVIDGVTIDAYTEKGSANNYAYGVYASKGATIDMYAGVIKTGLGSCISTNNTTGGGTINIKGGELYCDGSYAIYNAAQGNVNISGGKVQGINARMGKINITGNAEIIPTTITSENCDEIGNDFKTSGCVWLGDTIALLVGTYTDPDGANITLNIKDTASVKSNFRSAIGIYAIDTKQGVDVNVLVEKGLNVKTTDSEFSDIEVYDHDYIASEATKKGKSYTASVESQIQVKVGNSITYPAA